MGLLARLFGLEPGAYSIVDDLLEDYRAEMEQAVLLRQHADTARYPQIAATLRRLADMEERHAALLADRLAARGERVPPIASVPVRGRNPWERACDARARASQKRRRLIEHWQRWDPEEPNVVALWRQIEAEDQREFGAYEQIVMRGDPHAID